MRSLLAILEFAALLGVICVAFGVVPQLRTEAEPKGPCARHGENAVAVGARCTTKHGRQIKPTKEEK